MTTNIFWNWKAYLVIFFAILLKKLAFPRAFYYYKKIYYVYAVKMNNSELIELMD